MGRPERLERYRDDRDYAHLLGEEDYEQEDREEEVMAEPVIENKDDHRSQECQEYYERRERLKELERQRFRRTSGNNRSVTSSKRKPLPYDNYGTFFGPSEPIVTRRIITDVKARETASKVAARQAQEVSEPERVSKGSSGMVSDQGAVEAVTTKPSKAVNEQALRSQRLREARDYSFLFTDEDPAASPPRDDVYSSKKEQQDNTSKQHLSAKGSAGTTPRAPNGANPMTPNLAKPKTGGKAGISKGQPKHVTPTTKVAHPPGKPLLPKAKLSSQSGSISNTSKTTSGPGRPLEPRPKVPVPGISNGKKPLSSSMSTQLKSLVASPKSAKQSLPISHAKTAPDKGSQSKSATFGTKEKHPPKLAGINSQASTSHPTQKQTNVMTGGRGVSTVHLDQRRPTQNATAPKMKMKPPQKIPLDSESGDSFLDDDDDGQDYSSMIRKMFRYNPNKYRDIDDEDDRLMEANFRTIQMEEKRSARIAREEDERELALIEEEERRERERARKKRKQQR